MQEELGVEPLRFLDDGTFPNSAKPLLLYRGVIEPGAASPEAFEALFEANGWPPEWRASIFTYHHYHSTAHEALGIASGHAEVQFGGPKGQIVRVTAGDAVVIPAGVAHKRVLASADFLVVGSYPPGQDWDILRGQPDERPKADENIRRVRPPATDPVRGEGGPLLLLWG